MELKKTPFYKSHIQHKGKMVDFAGWALPLEYQSILKEAKETRSRCGVFDASHMGEILIKGSAALKLLQNLLSNDISLVKKGRMQYNLFLNKKGGIIDDLMVYHLGDSFMCVVNASNKDKVLNWLKMNLIDGAQVYDKSDSLALISLQGPLAPKIAEEVFDVNIAGLDYMNFTVASIDDYEVLISRSGYTGEDGFEIYVPWGKAAFWWDEILKKGFPFGLALCGLGARDILRVEAGYPLYGHEIDEETNPYEASLGWAIKADGDLVGKGKAVDAKIPGLNRKRIGFIMDDRAFARQDYKVYSGTKEIGKVTSGVYSPNLGRFIGMASIDKDHTDIGNNIDIKIRDKFCKAKIVKLPFISPRTKKVRAVREPPLLNEGGVKCQI